MKTLFTALLLMTQVVIQIEGQELMKIGEVFNFEVNDEFHYSGNNPEQPPNADRIKIIEKYYSVTGDTLFYVRSHDSYFTSIIWDPEPYLEYHFWTDTTTKFYYHLDSSIYYYDVGFQYDTSIYYSNIFCDSLINECEYEIGEFEPDYYLNIYGKGLGLVYEYLFQGGGPSVAYDIGMFYYKKNGLECGIPDTTTVGIKNLKFENRELIVFPNPATSFITINIKEVQPIEEAIIYNHLGQKALEAVPVNNTVDVSKLKPGIYFIEVVTKEWRGRTKLVIE